MLRCRGFRLFFFSALAVVAGFSAHAEEAANVLESVERGQVNWTEKTVLATGSGAPDLKIQNVAEVRMNAERSAKAAALKNMLEAIKGVRITKSATAKAPMGTQRIAAQVESIIKSCKTVDTRYFSDYGVDVVVECPLDGALAAVLAPPETYEALTGSGPATFSGLVVDAVGLKAKPALAPKLFRGAQAVYRQENVKPSFLKRHGAAAYFANVEAAKTSGRVGDKPLVLKAVSIGEGGTDIVLDETEAAKLEGVDLSFLAEGRVAIATDG